MNPARREWLRGLMLASASSATSLVCGAAAAQDSAARPLVLVVPFAAGGGTDNVARLIGQSLQARLGRSVVIENRPGANGLIASQAVLQQAVDGNTALLGSFSTHVIAALASRRNAEAARGLLTGYASLGVVGYAPLALAVERSAPSRTLAEFVDSAKTRRTTYGTFGAGSSAHLLGQIIASRTQAQLEHVPYKGSGPATTDLLGRHVDSVILTAAAITTQAASGQLRPLAVSSKARLPALPDVPTFAESGYSGLADTGWFAVFVPTRAPDDAKARWAAALAATTADPAVRQRLVDLGLEPAASGEDAQALWQRSLESARAMFARIKFDIDS